MELALPLDRIMLMDGLYSAIMTCGGVDGAVTETRELEGVPYTAEVYPATESQGEYAFYYDDAGRLVFCSAGVSFLPPISLTAAFSHGTLFPKGGIPYEL